MRCDLCPLWPTGFDDVCPEMDGEYGITHADGVAGCRHPRNWVEKREREYDRYLGMMADSIVKWMKEQENRRTEDVGNTDRLEDKNDDEK